MQIWGQGQKHHQQHEYGVHHSKPGYSPLHLNLSLP
jgi:hypothetical protein